MLYCFASSGVKSHVVSADIATVFPNGILSFCSIYLHCYGGCGRKKAGRPRHHRIEPHSLNAPFVPILPVLLCAARGRTYTYYYNILAFKCQCIIRQIFHVFW